MITDEFLEIVEEVTHETDVWYRGITFVYDPYWQMLTAFRECDECSGTGEIEKTVDGELVAEDCPECDGDGQIELYDCNLESKEWVEVAKRLVRQNQEDDQLKFQKWAEDEMQKRGIQSLRDWWTR